MEREGEGTKFTLDRKIFSSDIWFDSPWKLKIWVYLIGNANHTDGHFMGIPIKRGQLIRSYRTIAKDCGYYIGYRFKKPSINTVRRVCEDLMKQQRLIHRTVQPGTLFTICNYNNLQSFPKPRTAQRKPESWNNTGTKQECKECKNNIYGQNFLSFWKAYPHKIAKKKAQEAWQKLEKAEDMEALLPTLLDAIEKQKQAKEIKKANGEFVSEWPNPATWLNGRRWEDEIEIKKRWDHATG